MIPGVQIRNDILGYVTAFAFMYSKKRYEDGHWTLFVIRCVQSYPVCLYDK